MKERWSQVCGLGNWINGAAILSEGTQGRERFRKMIRFGEVSFGPIGVKVLMGNPSGDIYKLLDVDSTKESRARNIHLDHSVYSWASCQGYVEVNEEIVWDEKKQLACYQHLNIGEKGQATYEEEWEEVAREEGRKGVGWCITSIQVKEEFQEGSSAM